MEKKKQEEFSLSEILQSAMDDQQLIPIRLSEISGVPNSIISRLLNGRSASAENLFKLLRALKMIGEHPVYPYVDKEVHDMFESVFLNAEKDVVAAYIQSLKLTFNRLMEAGIMKNEINHLKNEMQSIKKTNEEILRRLPHSATRKTGSV